MNDRIHAYLDGDLPRDQLTAEELAEAEAFALRLAATEAELRDVPVPDFTASVMGAIHAEDGGIAHPRRPVWDRLRQWFWSPRPLTLQWRGAYAFAPVAALALILALGVLDGSPAAPPAEVASAPEAEPAQAAPTLYVQFRLEAPQARSVELAGSFTDWAPDYQMTESAPGVWTAMVPLDPGVHDYTFVVDGEQWVADPYAPQIDDDFGGQNSRLFLPPPGHDI